MRPDQPPVPIQQMAQAPVTLLDIYTRQVEMGGQLAVIHEQLRAIPDHEQRIRLLEAGHAKILGASAAIAVVISAAGTWIGLAITHH